MSENSPPSPPWMVSHEWMDAELNRRRYSLNLVLFGLSSLFVLFGLAWANYQYVTRDSGANGFIPAWAATRWFMVNGWNPYGEETRIATQKLMYGRPAQPGEDQGFFVYPLYSMVFFVPLALVKDAFLARTLWMMLMELALLAIAWMGVALTDWKAPRWMMVFIFGFIIVWYHSLRPLLNSNVSILVALLITGMFLAIHSGQDAWAGVLLALSSLKPHAILVLTIFVLFWAVSQRRWRIFWGVIGTYVLLIAAASLFVPNWLIQYAQQIMNFTRYTFLLTPRVVLKLWLPGVGDQLSRALTILALGILVAEWRAVWKKDFRWFLWTAYLTISAALVCGLPTSLEDYVILLPVFLLILATWDERWGVLGRGLVLISLALQSLGFWGLVLHSTQVGTRPDLSPAVFFFAPLFMVVGLYWVRYWAINPLRLPLKMTEPSR